MFTTRPDFERGLVAFERWAGSHVSLDQFVIGARNELQRLAGVSDLSIIEAVRLRRCVENALEMFADQFLKPKYGELLNILREAVYSWLATSYDLTLDDVHRELFRQGGGDEVFRTWLASERALAHRL